MMTKLQELLRNNREWADAIVRDDPGFFERLSRQQAPKFLWIGCSDSRVPANQIMGLAPGEVDVLEIEHIIVVGHYGCGGVGAALHGTRVGLADNWIRHVGDVAQKHAALLEGVAEDGRHDALCELNAIEQAENVCLTTVVRDAWARGQKLAVHGWVYSLQDGRVRELAMDVDSPEALEGAYRKALDGVRTRRGVAA